MHYTAKTKTFLKESLEPASTRPKAQKIKVEKGTGFNVKVIKTNELHDYIQMAHDGCCWWVYRPHWKIEP
jgi:hypothetical protein